MKKMMTMNRDWMHRCLMLMMCIGMMVGGNQLQAQSYYDDEYDGSITFQDFYRELTPYGVWVDEPEYGRVWIPRVEAGFHPYGTNGYWTVTEYGNTWVSNYRWGWAPFHYGRWYFSNRYGWAWVPGYKWAPAWVTWRSGGGYYGWAPIGPRMGIEISINLPISWWVFLPDRYMYKSNMFRHYVAHHLHQSIFHRTAMIRNMHRFHGNHYFSGPTPKEFRHATGRNVKVMQLAPAPRAGRTSVSHGKVTTYHPTVAGRPAGGDNNSLRQQGHSTGTTRSKMEQGNRVNRPEPKGNANDRGSLRSDKQKKSDNGTTNMRNENQPKDRVLLKSERSSQPRSNQNVRKEERKQSSSGTQSSSSLRSSQQKERTKVEKSASSSRSSSMPTRSSNVKEKKERSSSSSSSEGRSKGRSSLSGRR